METNRLTRPYAILTIALGILFLASGALKLLDVPGFGVQVMSYKIINSAPVVRLLAPAVIGLEIALALALLLGLCRRTTLAALGLLILGFSGAILYAWMFHGLKDCGCLGGLFPMTPPMSLTKNAVILAAIVATLLLANKLPREAINTAAPAMSCGTRLTLSAGLPAALVVGLVLGDLQARASSPTTGTAASFVPRKPPTKPAEATPSMPPTDEVASTQPPTAPPTETLPAAAASADRPAPTSRFARFVFQAGEETINLGRGEHFVAFLSATCEHCEAAVPNLNFLAQAFPELPPITGLVLGTEQEMLAFAEKTQPDFSLFLIDSLVFMEFIGSAPPRFHYTRDGESLQSWDMEPPGDVDIAVFLEEHGAGAE